MLDWLLGQLGIKDAELLINSIGDQKCRPEYVAELKRAIAGELSNLCVNCKQRYQTNPLRVLDCKEESCQPHIAKLPAAVDYLCGSCRDHFYQFRQLLEERGINYQIAPRLVRGLDYYTRTAFEIVSRSLGAQNALVGGGRYDKLSEALGGPPAKGFGFALGLERLVMAVPEESLDLKSQAPALYIAYVGEQARRAAFNLARRLRRAGISVVVDLEGRRLRKSLALADAIKASYALIIGEDELKANRYTLRDMVSGQQRSLSEEELQATLKSLWTSLAI
jgi:histidyl-tRNA synthetase